VPVEVVAGPLWRVVVPRSAWRAAIWTSVRSTPESSVVVTSVTKHVRGAPSSVRRRCRQGTAGAERAPAQTRQCVPASSHSSRHERALLAHDGGA